MLFFFFALNIWLACLAARFFGAGDEDVVEDCYDKWVSSLVDLLPEVPMGPSGWKQGSVNWVFVQALQVEL